MKIIYKINSLYDKDDTLKVAVTLLKIIMKSMFAMRAKFKNLKSTDFVFYPLNPYRIGKGKKLMLISSKKADGLAEYIDEQFMNKLEKENLKVQREEIV